MPTVNINDCFPVAADGTRGPLPKQAEFMQAAIPKEGPSYVCYAGGIGSGKTLIGCLTVLSWAVLYGGLYLVGRQYYPELRDTTLKTFLDICPPELILEYRVADGIIKVRSMDGKPAEIYFRHLEEPDKLRSMNLSGFYIDEAAQVSEYAFLLLQGRLRNLKGPRKGILTTNVRGHDYIYRHFVKKEYCKTDETKAMFHMIKAPSTENIHLPPGYVQQKLDLWSEVQIQREIYASFDSFEGQVYSEFQRDLHVVRPYKIDKSWERIIGIDHGYRNPAVWLWAAVDYDGNVHVFREYYVRERLIEDIAKDVNRWVVKELEDKHLSGAYIDPSTQARRAQGKGEIKSDFQLYDEALPKDFPLFPACNEVSPGIEQVKRYFKVDPKTKKPRIFIFNTCTNLIDELSTYRWKDTSMLELENKDYKEEPQKKDDHACDALRYLMMSLPDRPTKVDKIYDKIKYNSLEGALYRDCQETLHKPKSGKDPWGDA